MAKKVMTALVVIGVLSTAFAMYKLNPERVCREDGFHYGVVDKSAINVSFDEVLSNPQKFDGKMIRIKGYSYFHPEGDALFPDDTYAVDGNMSDYIPIIYDVDAVGIDESGIFDVDRKLILIEGIYDTKDSWVNGFMPGGIKNVTRVEIWENRLLH